MVKAVQQMPPFNTFFTSGLNHANGKCGGTPKYRDKNNVQHRDNSLIKKRITQTFSLILYFMKNLVFN